MSRLILRPFWCALSVFTLSFAAQAVESAAKAPATAESTVRLRTRTPDGEYTVTGFGAAFGIDLSAYGISDSNYMLSAAHLVLANDGRGLKKGDLEVELLRGTYSIWATCEVVATDKKRDLCLLKCKTALPGLARLERKGGGNVGDTVMIVGCPSGVKPCISMGRLTDKEPNVSGVLWEAAANFYHGNSGGPVFDAKAGTVLGVAVAGVSDGHGDMSRKVALFSPYFEVEKFLNTAMKKIAAQ